MGLFDGWWGESKSDPLGRLDPGTKAFLEKESPVRYHLATPKPKEEAGSSDAEAKGEDQPAPLVPKESLFPDGRYAHLWKTYRPLGEIEAETKTDNEKLTDILDGYKERKRLVARAAYQSCAVEQTAWRECMTEGGFRGSMTMCSKETKKFERCYAVQKRLLRALGSYQHLGRAQEVEDDIQIHAYDIYQAMLKQERLIKAARKAGEPIPQFPPLIPHKLSDEEEYLATLPQTVREELQAKLNQVGAVGSDQRGHTLAVFKREYMERSNLTKEAYKLWEEQDIERQKRLKEGKATVGDRVKTAWDAVGKSDRVDPRKGKEDGAST